MTKKDFELIAEILADNREGAEPIIDTLAEHFACALTYENPRFDEARFIAACKKDKNNG